MTPYETIVMTAKPHGNGFACDLRPDGKTWGRPSIRAWYSRHPVTNDKPPLLLYRAVGVIAAHPDSTPEERRWGAPVLDDLKAACHEPYLDLPEIDRINCQNLALEIAKWAMRETAECQPRAAMWAALTVLFWLDEDTEHGLLVEESHLHRAVYALTEAGNRHPDIVSRYANSARKAARRLAKVLARIELFPTAAVQPSMQRAA